MHKKREDSIIIDLFNGQLKSETICQVCKKSSITYDPFMSLCVPLPNSKKHLSFKIFCGRDCIYFDFQFNENSTISDLKKGAINYIYQLTGNTKFDLETVILDANKNISEIISTDITGKNFKGPVQLRNVLINNEIVFYEKSREKLNDYMNIFIYPIEHQKPDLNYYTYYNQNNPIQLKYISYPNKRVTGIITNNKYTNFLVKKLIIAPIPQKIKTDSHISPNFHPSPLARVANSLRCFV